MRNLLRLCVPLQMRLAYRRRVWTWCRKTLARISVHYLGHLDGGAGKQPRFNRGETFRDFVRRTLSRAVCLDI